MKNNSIILRLLKTIKQFYPIMFPLTIICIIFNAVISSIPTIFMQNIIALVEDNWKNGSWDDIGNQIIFYVEILATFYLLSLAAGFIYNQLMAIITQGTLMKLREKMFAKMQYLLIKYFDTNNHGDIMSHYTNDIDTLRQMISQSLPQLLISGVTVLTIFIIMIYYCFWLTGVILIGVVVMFILIKKIGGNSARYFFNQQKALGEVEGFVEEMMNCLKVVKVFCHEEESFNDFNSLNEKLYEQSMKANRYANILGPILNNIGNVLYVLVAVTGACLLILDVPNISLSMMPLSLSITVPFLNMTKQFVGNIGQVSHQINAVIMGIAGAKRIFDLMDQEVEVDNGYVTLVNITNEDGQIKECQHRTGLWAWKHPHKSDNTITYTLQTGNIVLDDVDFQYEENKPVLHNISLYAKPGQKVAFVGATGAGKTTITNLLNRFYDIADGKIRYDGININKIKKADLRHSLGIVLQDTNMFTGTVMDNIRYGRLNATDQECIEAAKLAGADDFITRLPNGYQTMLAENGSNLSQGQRQLLSIARVAVANPPVMILDEATSSIDTRTEAIIQKGMDALMEGRTTFVIAHRLSTVKNADVIIVLDHGRIIERGSHQELIEQKGQYYQLYTGAFELE